MNSDCCVERQPGMLVLKNESCFACRNVRPKMTIYVCQEHEQNRSHLHQKRENGGDGNVCGKCPVRW